MLGHRLRTSYVPRLAALVTATKQNDQDVASARKINPITWAMIHSKFAQAVANRFDIAEQTNLNASDALLDTFRGNIISKRCQPMGELFCLADLDRFKYNAQPAPECQL